MYDIFERVEFEGNVLIFLFAFRNDKNREYLRETTRAGVSPDKKKRKPAN